jgi:hypothetical protein
MRDHRREAKERGVRRVSVTLTATEFASLVSAAMVHDEPPTAHLKRRAFAHMSDTYLVPPDLQTRLDSALAVLRGIGNNLNQLARHSNEMKYFLDTEFVRADLKRMDQAIRELVTQPARATPSRGD